jgi:pyruvate,orthophosphate dikinase
VKADTQLVYDFAEGSRDMRDLLGGKGANVAEMTRVLGAERVPAGFTITTEACVAYMEADRTELHDVAAMHPDRVREMSAAYEAWAKRCGVIPRERIVALMRSQGVTRAFWEKPDE